MGSVFAVRGLPHDQLYVLGLSEAQFPARDPEDALYLDAERRAVNESLASAGLSLTTRAEHADESSLFYEITALARRKLILLRPYSADGTPWPPSAYWQATHAALGIAPQHIPMDLPVSIEEAASVPEVLLAVAHALSKPMPAVTSTSETGVFSAAAWLNDQPDHAQRWQQVQRIRAIELRRAAGVRDEYSGYLQADLTRRAISTALGSDRLWSAAQFNRYGQCPFGFFIERFLNLQPLQEPEPGMDAMARGSLIHAILEALYRQIAVERLTITAENRARALEILEEAIQRHCAAAPAIYGFRPDALWTQTQDDLRRQLETLVKRDFSDSSPLADLLPGQRRPGAQESWFGQIIIEGQAGPVRARGRIDRIDVANGRALVIDYKTGGAKFYKADLLEGRNVQMLLYFLAVQQEARAGRLSVDARTVSGAFWHTANQKLSGNLEVAQDADLLNEAQAALHQRVIAARNGQFPNVASAPKEGKCTPYCKLSALCRMRTRQHADS